MKMVTGVLIAYCLLIGGAALFDTLADPNGQPLMNIVTAVAMGVTLFGIFSRRKELVLAIPVYAAFYMAFAATKQQDLPHSVGMLLGIALPVALAIFQYRKMKASQPQLT